MGQFQFTGFPDYLRLAAGDLEADRAHASAPPPPSLSALANLCAQATLADPEHVAGILGEAAVHRDRLRVAARAAELMLEDVEQARLPEPVPEPEAPVRPRSSRSVPPRP